MIKKSLSAFKNTALEVVLRLCVGTVRRITRCLWYIRMTRTRSMHGMDGDQHYQWRLLINSERFTRRNSDQLTMQARRCGRAVSYCIPRLKAGQQARCRGKHEYSHLAFSTLGQLAATLSDSTYAILERVLEKPLSASAMSTEADSKIIQASHVFCMRNPLNVEVPVWWQHTASTVLLLLLLLCHTLPSG